MTIPNHRRGKLSRFVDYKDRATCVLFGDAGAALLCADEPEHEILTVELGADPSGADLVDGRDGR